jgi:hypothetical protein
VTATEQIMELVYKRMFEDLLGDPCPGCFGLGRYCDASNGDRPAVCEVCEGTGSVPKVRESK